MTDKALELNKRLDALRAKKAGVNPSRAIHNLRGLQKKFSERSINER